MFTSKTKKIFIMYCIDGSGGGLKIRGIAEVWNREVEKNGMPNIFSGVSASSILTLPFAVGKKDEVLKLVENVSFKTIFSKRPIFNNNFPTPYAIKNILLGKHYIGEMGNLYKNLSKIVTLDDYLDYISSDKPICLVMATRYSDNKKVVFDLKNDNLTYHEALNCIIASSSIAGIVPPIEIKGEFYYDGGYRDHTIGAYVLKNYDITNFVSVFSRPYYLSRKDDNLNEREYAFNLGGNEPPKNIIEAISWGWDSHMSEVSLGDEIEQREICKKKGVSIKQYFLPNVLKGIFDTKKERLDKLADLGRVIKPTINIKR